MTDASTIRPWRRISEIPLTLDDGYVLDALPSAAEARILRQLRDGDRILTASDGREYVWERSPGKLWRYLVEAVLDKVGRASPARTVRYSASRPTAPSIYAARLRCADTKPPSKHKENTMAIKLAVEEPAAIVPDKDEQPTTPSDVFDRLGSLRLRQTFDKMKTKKPLATVGIRKSKPNEWCYAHPEHRYEGVVPGKGGHVR